MYSLKLKNRSKEFFGNGSSDEFCLQLSWTVSFGLGLAITRAKVLRFSVMNANSLKNKSKDEKKQKWNEL